MDSISRMSSVVLTVSLEGDEVGQAGLVGQHHKVLMASPSPHGDGVVVLRCLELLRVHRR